jgi:hypothetical protein
MFHSNYFFHCFRNLFCWQEIRSQQLDRVRRNTAKDLLSAPRTYKLHQGHVRMVQITQRRFPMTDTTIFYLFPKIDFDWLKNIKIIPYFLGAWRQPINYLWLHKAGHVQSSVSVYGLCSCLIDNVYGNCLLFIYEPFWHTDGSFIN